VFGGGYARCQEVSQRPNFLILLGDRYGWRPLPEVVPQEEFESVRQQVKSDSDGKLLDAWYELDENAVPPIYFLRPRMQGPGQDADPDETSRVVEEELTRYRADDGTLEAVRKAAKDSDIQALDKAEKSAWQKTEGKLLEIIRKAAATVDLDDEQRRKYIASATEQEIEKGVMQVEKPEDHVFCFFRTINGFPCDDKTKKYDASVKEYLDIQLEDDEATEGPLDEAPHDMLLDLKERLEKRLGGNVFPCEADWTGGATGPPITDSHIDKLCKDVEESLSRVIEQEIEELQRADEAGVVDTVAMEVEAQKKFGEGRARHFTGREAELDTIARYVSGSDTHAFAVYGEGGCGKSAFVARAFELAKGDNPETAIFRSIGATPSSSDIRSLLDGLCRQISDLYGADKSTVPSTYEDLVKDFKERLDLAGGGGTLVIFLDALDQLSDAHNARSMVWLPNEVPGNVRLVVSTRPGNELVTLRRKLPEQNVTQLGPMSRAEGDSLLNKWLADVGRTVQDPQREEILTEFEASDGNPLYLRMAFQEARRWTSAMTGKDIHLGTSVVGIIKNLYDRLSDNRNHGKVLTGRALGYLAASRQGLSEDEFIDILSKDADPVVLEDFLDRSPDSPQDIERLPVAVWSRLFLDLEPYLTERISENATLLYFYHRELGDVAEEIYLNDSTREERHRVLAEYFNRKGDPQGDGYRADKVDERKRWEGSSRALSELPYHVTHADMMDELFSTLTDFEFLENKAARVSVSEFAGSNDQTEKLYGGVFELQKDYELALETFPTE